MIVREALVADPLVLAPDAPAREAAAVLARPNVESVLVTEGERLLGCITKTCIVEAVAEGRDLRELAARDLADPDVATVGPETPLDEALHLMGERGLERLAVTEEGRLLGVLQRDPVVRRLVSDEAVVPEAVAGEEAQQQV